MTLKHFLSGCYIVCLFILSLFTGSCSKDLSNSNVTSNGTIANNYLVSSPWHYVRYEEEWNMDGNIDYRDTPMACQSQASYTFLTDNLMQYQPAIVSCDSSDVPTTTTWALVNNGSILSWWGVNYNIKMLNDTVLNIYFDSVFKFNGEKYRGFFIYKH